MTRTWRKPITTPRLVQRWEMGGEEEGKSKICRPLNKYKHHKTITIELSSSFSLSLYSMHFSLQQSANLLVPSFEVSVTTSLTQVLPWLHLKACGPFFFSACGLWPPLLCFAFQLLWICSWIMIMNKRASMIETHCIKS